MVLPLYVNGTTVPQIGIVELYGKADIVAIVSIESGVVLSGEDFPCGVKYHGKVLNALKNVKVNDVIEFGYYIGYGVGSMYLVFLNKKNNVYEPITNTNLASINGLAVFNRQCHFKHPNFLVMHNGFGVQKIQSPPETDYKDAFLIRTKYLRLPKNTKLVSPEKQTCYSWEKCRWVRKDIILKIFQAK